MIRDLLNPSSGFLDLREDSKGVIQVAGITEVSTINAQEVSQFTFPSTTWPIYFNQNTQKLQRPEITHTCVFLDHGAPHEGQQTAHPGANSRQSDVISLPRCATSSCQTAEPLSWRSAGGPLCTPLHDWPRRLRTSSTGVCTYIYLYMYIFIQREWVWVKLLLSSAYPPKSRFKAVANVMCLYTVQGFAPWIVSPWGTMNDFFRG